MRKLEFRLVLPITQLVLAVILLFWGHRVYTSPDYHEVALPSVTLVCFGINAPALIFRVLGAWFSTWRTDQAPSVMLGLGVGEWFFLVGVAVLWYLIGRWFDRRRTPESPPRSANFVSIELLLNLFIMALGGYLLLETIRRPGQWGTSVGRIAQGLLFLVWSVILIFVPGRKLVRRFLWKADR